MKSKVLVTRKLPEAVEARLVERFDTKLNPSDKPLTSADLTAAMGIYDGIVPTVSDHLCADILKGSARRVQIIANVGVGFSNIDTEAARELGVTVSNTPDVLTDATADIAMLLILAATRGAYAAERKLRDGHWSGFSIVEGLGMGLQGKVLGIIGMGRIGRATAKRAALAFGMVIVFYNRSPVGDLEFQAKQLERVKDVMSIADVVSIHVPGGGTEPLVTASDIAHMKPSAYLINTARGDSLDESALIRALKDGHIAGAGLDVFKDEPNVSDDLRGMDNVTLLPHIGSATNEVRTAMGMLAVDNLEAFFEGRTLPSGVVTF